MSVVGTRPNFIKEMLINKYLKGKGIEEVLVHTGQHFDYEMSKLFFEELELPEPEYKLEVSTGYHGKQTAEILSEVEKILLKERPSVTLVYGDVNSTAAAALASAKLRIPVAHVESGVRDESIYNPEEINRRVTDHLSETLFAPTKEAYDNLIKENFPSGNVFLTGDVVKDSVLYIIKKFNLRKKKGDYHLATVHRAENTDSKARLSRIINAFLESEKRIIFPIHPRTKKKMIEYGIYNKLNGSNVEVVDAKGYIEFIKLLSGADRVLTDSGGVRREAYILGKPAITLIRIIWFPEMVKYGWNRVTDADPDEILEALRSFQPPKKRPPIFGDGKAAERCVNILEKRYG